MEKSPFTPACINKVKNLVSKENACSTLLSIRKDEAASHIKEAVTQAFKVKTEKESSGEESDGGGIELDYEDCDEAVVLPDEDEAANQTADDDIVEIGGCPSAIETSNPVGINDDDDVTNTQETTDEGIKGKKSAEP